MYQSILVDKWSMLLHYLKSAFRNIRKHKTQSFTGIFGLAFGLACFVPALYWMRYEVTYDHFYPHAEHIYRIYSVDKQSGKVNELVSGILERQLKGQFAAMQASTVFFSEQNDCSTVEFPHIRLRTIYTDSTFLNVFPQKIINGNSQQPLQVSGNIVLTETVAIRLFGNVENAIGQQIRSKSLLYDAPYTVTAVVKDPPANTNISFDALLSHEQVKQQKSLIETSAEQIWAFSFLQMYVRFHPNANADVLAEQLRDFPYQSYTNADIELRMLPISDVRHQLNSEAPFTLNFIGLFLISGLLLLFSAIFNLLSLHFDLFSQRIRELRQRAVNGASGSQLIQQILSEQAYTILLSLLLTACFLLLVRPAFSEWLNIPINIPQLLLLFVVCGMGIMVLMLLIGFLLHQRLILLAIRPLSERKIKSQVTIRRMAVTLQLAVSVLFIIAASMVVKQMRFVSNKDLGFKPNEIIHLSGLDPFTDNNVMTALWHEIEAIPQVESVTDASFVPQHHVNPYKMTTDVEWQGKPPFEEVAFNFIHTDSRFDETFGINMLAGEWLDEAGKRQIVLNEEAVRMMGLNEPVGSIIRMSLDGKKDYTVVGVVKDFHTLSLRNNIFPMIFLPSVYPTNSLYIRVMPGQKQEAIQRISSILPQIDVALSGVVPVTVDDLFDRLNHSEKAGLKIFSVLATVCLLISLFGIYAVAASSAYLRRKEIAVRKVLGAQSGNIVRMFFQEYALQVIIAGILALPIAYYIMRLWLQGYAYRTDISWWVLAGSVAGVIAVVLLTVLGQVLKAANSNPAEVVKGE